MILHHTKKEVKRFDTIKLIIALILLAILIIMLLTGNAVNDTAVSDTTTPDETTTEVENADVALAAPAFDAPDGTFNSGEVVLSGTGEPGSDVAILVDGEVVGTTTVGSDGTWSFATDLEAGDYTVSAQTLDADGNIAAESDGLAVSVADALALPTISLPEAGLMAGTVALSGTGTPGSTVELFADGVSIGTTTVGEDGTWVFDAELGDGDVALTAQAMDDDGNETAVSAPLNLSLASIDLPDFELPTLTIPNLGFTPDGFAIGGTGTPGQDIEIVVDGEVVGTTTVGEDGTWSYNLDLA
ncbi:MAG: hypothetical protein GY943_18545, partial [Chloroflexi bacterium]|nr:hypothetical protein [Chloroflexota bacterium]